MNTFQKAGLILKETFTPLARKFAQYNMQAEIEWREREKAIQREAMMELYPLIAEMLMEAINRTSDATGLLAVRSIDQVTNKKCPIKTQCNGMDVYIYRGLYGGSNITPFSSAESILQNELNQIAASYGFDEFVIKVTLDPRNNKVVEIKVVFKATAQRYRSASQGKAAGAQRKQLP